MSSAAIRKHLSKVLNHPSQRSIFHQLNALHSNPFLFGSEVAQHSPFPTAHKGSRNLAVDVKEYKDQIEIVAELPGMTKDQVQVEIHEGNILTLSGEYKNEDEVVHSKQPSSSSPNNDAQVKYHFSERSYGKFERAFQFPDHIKLEHVTAQMRDGILKLLIPKEQPKPIRRKVNIEI